MGLSQGVGLGDPNPNPGGGGEWGSTQIIVLYTCATREAQKIRGQHVPIFFGKRVLLDSTEGYLGVIFQILQTCPPTRLALG